MIDEKVTISSENVTLLGMEVDSNINLDKNISKICNKTQGQLNAPCTIGYSIEFEEQKILIDSFIYALLYTCMAFQL